MTLLRTNERYLSKNPNKHKEEEEGNQRMFEEGHELVWIEGVSIGSLSLNGLHVFTIEDDRTCEGARNVKDVREIIKKGGNGSDIRTLTLFVHTTKMTFILSMLIDFFLLGIKE